MMIWRQKTFTNVICDKHWHGRNLAKLDLDLDEVDTGCPICGSKDDQRHSNFHAQ